MGGARRPPLLLRRQGIVRAPFQTRAFGQGIARQPDGKLLAAGVVHPAQGYEQVALVRFQPDGTLDASFGTGGVALATVGTDTPRRRRSQGCATDGMRR
ncbi:MAG: hypothetical protein E6J71_20400 [Deltaproteobacteria bacterium]|nr:MAG: hypothetical protein E6J76_05305 [Deltaproteobacteria bacterium]TMB15147.1 MAG: hypothetical protein E6J71_20400 [Deltaproteobacteria bacterium]